MTLVGRTTAIKTLADAFTDCAEGCSRTVLVEGPTGCGKSALVHGLIERAAAAGAVVLCATGSPAGRRTAWGVVRQLLAHRCGPRRWENTAERAPGIGHLRALCAELRAVSGGSPLVLCVDDVEYADEESLAFVRHLAYRARPARVLLVVAGTAGHESGGPLSLAGPAHGPAPSRIRLERLGRPEVSALAERAGAGEHAAFLYESSGGSPLLLHALLDELALHELALPASAGPGTFRPVP
ncbi:ATP-binding protein, partial [Streptomyces rhizosphaerihabitans]|uniref:ATP-binding protein n=1 Tax=Streptomyces rhizosphaerihabitans TaxID=1266770 RepID=UPI0021BEA3ED